MASVVGLVVRIVVLLSLSSTHSCLNAGEYSVTRGPTSHSADGSIRFTTSVTLSNTSIIADPVFLCSSFDVPESSLITSIRVKPDPRLKYHVNVNICDEPGYRSTDGREQMWECGRFGRLNPPLPHAPHCLMQGQVSDDGYLVYQHQGADLQHSALTLAPGSGIPVGGGAGPRTVLVYLHFKNQKQDSIFHTGDTTVDLDFVQNFSPDSKKVGGLAFETFAHIGPASIGSVTGSWTHKTGSIIHVVAIHTHWHDLAVRVTIAVRRQDGERDVILDQDTRETKGSILLPDPATKVIKPWNTVTVTCTYNNTLPYIVSVWDREMCSIILYYTVEEGELLATKTVISREWKHYKCFPMPDQPAVEVNNDATTSYEGEVPDADCDEDLFPLKEVDTS